MVGVTWGIVAGWHATSSKPKASKNGIDPVVPSFDISFPLGGDKRIIGATLA
jgi:hypothetical protein